MLIEIIRKEVLEHLMSLRFSIACVLCLLVMLGSLFVRVQDYQSVTVDYNENTSQARAELKEIRHPGHLLWRGLSVHQGPNPLKVFVRGLSDDNGMSLRLRASEPVQFSSGFMANPLLPLFPSMDVVYFCGRGHVAHGHCVWV